MSAAAIPLAAADPATLPKLLDRVALAWDRFHLPNGLTVIVHEDRAVPLVTVAVWYKVGAKDEVAGKTGLAHLFEHLMFGGSANMPGSYLSNMGQVGPLDINGTTNFDRTNFFQTVQTGALDVALFAESDRMGHFLETLGPAVLEQQRQVVMNEKRETEGAPFGGVPEAMALGLFPPDHPYAHTTLGWQPDLEAMTLQDARDWVSTYYAPSNAVLVLAGDIDLATARAKAAEFFGAIPPGPPLRRPGRWVPAHRGQRRTVLEDRVSHIRVVMAWNVPPAGDTDATRLSLVAPILGGGISSRLHRRLVETDGLARNVSAIFGSAMLSGQFVVSVDLADGASPAAVEAAIRDEIDRFRRDGPANEELERIAVNVEAGLVRQLQSSSAIAELLAMNEVFFGDPGRYEAEMQEIGSLVTDDLRAAAERWLATPDFTLHVVPRGSLRATGKDIDRAAGPAMDPPGGIALPAITERRLSNGIRVLVAERRNLPLVEIKLVVPRGAALEPRDRMGAAQFVAQLMGEGVGARTETEVQALAERNAIQGGAGIGFDYSGVAISTLRSRLALALDLHADMVRRPRFDPAAVERTRLQRLAMLPGALSSPGAAAQHLLPALMFGRDHAYARNGQGRAETIAAITRDDLVALHARIFDPTGATIIAAGDTCADEIVPLLEARFGDWQAASGAAAAQPGSARPPATGVWLIDRPGASQTSIAAALVIPSHREIDPLALTVLDRTLGGTFGSRINMNLREDKGWTYGVRSDIGGTLGERLYVTSGAVQADRTAESMAEIAREYAEIVSTRPITADNLATVRQSAILQLPSHIRTLGALAGSIEALVQLDRPLDHWTGYADRFNALGLEAVNALARRIIRPDALVWVVAGDLAAIEAPIRAGGFGPVHVVEDIDALYS